jgi:hypothetical protein
MKIKRVMIGMLLILGFTGNVSPAGATEPVNAEHRDLDMDRGTDRGSRLAGFGLDVDWGEDVDPEDMRELSKRLRDASPEDFKAAVDLLLNPDIPFEDAVAAVLMLLGEMMDEAIEEQAQKVQELQQGGGDGKTISGGETPSIDTEMMKLKQQTDRRGQLFDTMRQVVEKYDESAQGAIQRMR